VGREVKDHVRRRPADPRGDRAGIGQVELHERGVVAQWLDPPGVGARPAPQLDLVAVRQQPAGEDGADEPAGARDDRAAQRAAAIGSTAPSSRKLA